ncbi:hypothetical protein BTO32_14810 [Marinobacter lutaoensis]|uniref:Uncharacterized protein n=1 Tax=Marinobacter lutaoensis TaxID=135739 RepID=A0A1V2DPC9_9GAMM|nr:hypothetical protein [Marinobacter lutaoensis]ONF42482.1 hypothetical protein BTO32_14810 [Marinobacter lutaoensis]
MYDKTYAMTTGVSVSQKEKSSKPWSERIKAAHHGMAKYFAEYGTKTGLAGGTLLVMAGGATLLSAATATTPEAVEAARSASSAMILGGVLKIGAMSIAEHVAKLHLNGIDSLFEGAAAKDTTASQKGSGATLQDDPILQDPRFKRALVATFRDLQNDPETRASVVEMLQNSKQARKALLNAQRQIEEADKARQVSAVTQGAAEQYHGEEERPEAPRLH